MPTRISTLLLFTLLSVAANANPLAPFERLIGGKWVIVDYSYQRFHWGPGKHSVQARGYSIENGEEALTSTGFWYWDPEENAIVGVHSAADMQVNLFKYRTHFEGDTMVNELKSFGDSGAATYMEYWEFTDVDTYQWRLVEKGTDKPIMHGAFKRLAE
ncbi:hypothetical protein EY643_18295 [Halioglobus maricola]|uniref:DUF1579 domain-containing protein n=1 Tax=Halioglobus maricola TaxID=2601894 RepID=A0A5P9NNU2_9GAMM|nr:hypothetical protein [Halioglobus maricola]QFU77462.1 hypothetical protein EY643_18295 [Halioglobus maricola]